MATSYYFLSFCDAWLFRAEMLKIGHVCDFPCVPRAARKSAAKVRVTLFDSVEEQKESWKRDIDHEKQMFENKLNHRQ